MRWTWRLKKQKQAVILLYWIEERVLGTLLINDKVPTIIVFLISVNTCLYDNAGGMYVWMVCGPRNRTDMIPGTSN